MHTMNNTHTQAEITPATSADFFEGQNSGVAIYHRTGCPGDKKRIWFTYDRDPLGHLDRADKQALLEFMHKSGHAVASINL